MTKPLMITVTFRGHTLQWQSREEAIRFYTLCLRDSELALANAQKDHEDVIRDSVERLEAILDGLYAKQYEIDDFS